MTEKFTNVVNFSTTVRGAGCAQSDQMSRDIDDIPDGNPRLAPCTLLCVVRGARDSVCAIAYARLHFLPPGATQSVTRAFQRVLTYRRPAVRAPVK